MQVCEVHTGKIYYKEKLFLLPNDKVKLQVLYRTHSTGPRGYPSHIKTLNLLSRSYWWPGMVKEVETFVRACQLCTRTKASRLSPLGFLKPLPILFQVWSDISVNYITPLPPYTRNRATYKHILVTVCQVTKMRHFVPVTNLDAETLADTFVQRVYCLHSTPDNIISD
jgi:hypothetical protein